jgi:hypothetical protein
MVLGATKFPNSFCGCFVNFSSQLTEIYCSPVAPHTHIGTRFNIQQPIEYIVRGESFHRRAELDQTRPGGATQAYITGN